MRNIRFEEGDLGVHVNVLRKWITDFEADPAQAFPGQGQMKPEQAETRDEARADMFDYVERFYNPKRRHSTLGYLSPIAFEQQEALA